MNIFTRRKVYKRAREWLRHATHVRHTRDDLMSVQEIESLAAARAALARALKSREPEQIKARTEDLADCIQRLTPTRSFPWFRENFEIVVVAIAVAMGFRSYFMQPFKIPTGSMQPTLYGVTSVSDTAPGWFDRVPFRYLKWLATGESYRRVHARASGHLMATRRMLRGPDPHVAIAGLKHKIPRGAELKFTHGDYVREGQLLWKGHTRAGDHIFVDKVSWNFRRPRRGDIMVFNTRSIPGLPEGTHYIKRLAGLPGENLAIDPPNLLVNGKPVQEPQTIARIAQCRPGYAGYRLIGLSAPARSRSPLRTPEDSIQLRDDEFFALGDNTRNSKDGRYWGAVPRENMVGPAFLVYWPFSSRWGLAD